MRPEGLASPKEGRPRPRVRRTGSYLLGVIRGRRGLIPIVIRGVLSVFALVYVVGLKLYLLLYRIGIRRATRLPCPVICVGNLTTGGTGKTPTTQMLCRLLQDQGKKAAVLIRGYGGQNEFGCQIVSDGESVRLSASEAGDEAYLLARTLPGIPIVVGKDRIRTGRLAHELFKPDVIVMDDGMQHWRLHRDLDIALLNACDPFDNGWTFPRGLLREPPGHLRRAGMIVLTNTRRAGDTGVAALRMRVAKYSPGHPIFSADLFPVALLDLKGREAKDLAWLDGRRVGALCALGNPASFESMLGEQGAILAARFRYRDHHAITAKELERIVAEAEAAGAEAVLTTEKDAVKMSPVKTRIPLFVLRVAMQVSDEAAFIALVTKNTPLHKPENDPVVLTIG